MFPAVNPSSAPAKLQTRELSAAEKPPKPGMLPGVERQPREEGGRDLGKFVELEHFNSVRTKRSDFPRTDGGDFRGNCAADGGEGF